MKKFVSILNVPALCILLALSQAVHSKQEHSHLQDGDLIFQTSRSSQSLAIQLATKSAYSHMGVILFKNSKPYVLEASATVRYTPLNKWIAQGNDGHYVVKRLKNASTQLTATTTHKLHDEAKRFIGRPYDLTFEWSDNRIYCSELVWKLYDNALNIQIGKLQRLKEFNLSAPAVKAKLKERYGQNIPMQEVVISPEAMFKSDLLMLVIKK